MSEYLSRVDFVWPWVWLLLLLPLVGRFFMAKARPLKEYVRVPFLPALIHEIQPNSQPVRSGKLAAVAFLAGVGAAGLRHGASGMAYPAAAY
ncbi:Uncharacterised protein [Klebsiella michiganensis]|nr:Uncharacterised protein [Klebsiella michiganensis]